MQKSNILIIGAGKGGTSLLEILKDFSDVNLIGVVDKKANASGLKLAKELGLVVETNWKKFLHKLKIDIIINVTGDDNLITEIENFKSDETEVIHGYSAKLMLKLAREYHSLEQYKHKYDLAQRELDSFTPKESDLVGKSDLFKEIKTLVLKVAPTPTTVLLRGETGTGKEMIARLIHKNSHLSDKPFITINCTALTTSLMESELFGYKKGAFTGAETDRTGLFEKADKGTVFLDEIGDMNLELQAKLLRFLQTGEIRPVGSSIIKYVKVRIIAATNRNIEKAIENGEFRKDLFYRFNTFTINLPSLKERKIDIPDLTYHFINMAEIKLNKQVKGISEDALSLLNNYDWPGNVRELQNVIERAVILCSKNIILPKHLPHLITKRAQLNKGSTDPKKEKAKLINKFEKATILKYIEKANGNISEASRLSGIPRRTFYRWMKKYDI